jgi:hypothetical protein
MRMLRSTESFFRAVSALGFVIAASACSGRAHPAARGELEISPVEVKLRPGGAQLFTAQAQGENTLVVAWSVREGPAGGRIDGTGLYTAPTAAGTFHVVASDGDGARGVTATVQVEEMPPATIAVSVSPTTAQVAVRGAQQFSATVSGSSAGVVWSLGEKEGGAVTANGLYTAPALPGTFHVIAASAVDPSRRGVATVTVAESATGVAISIAPRSAIVSASASQQFSAQVSGAADSGVLWSIAEASGGAITPDGLYTAPATPGTYHVMATARADVSVAAVATVTVPVPAGVQVSVNPPSVVVLPGQTAVFAARVTGTPDGRVAWAVDENGGGTIDANGTYTAPATTGTFRVTAKSVADPSAVSSAAVVVQGRSASIAISPADVLIGPGGALQFDAALDPSLPDRLVTWSVQEGAAGGTVSKTGFYVAPSTAGTFHVVAQADGNGAVSIASVRVDTQMVSVSVSDPFIQATIVGGDVQLRYRATVHGTVDQSVTWSIAEGAVGGSIDSTGFYVPPDHSGLFHIVATSVADPARSATATYLLDSGPGASPDLVDRGAQLLPSARLYAVFWGPANDFAADTQAGIESLFKALDKSAYLAHLDQYFRGQLASAPYAAALFDGSPPPANEPTGADVAAAACRALDAVGEAPARDALYVVFSSNFPAGMDAVCAWHTWNFCHAVPIVIALVPNAAENPGGCLVVGSGAGGSVSAATAAMQAFALHEIVESMTDPFLPDGWMDPYSAEAADKCVSDLALTQLGGETFWLESVWSNADHRCVR